MSESFMSMILKFRYVVKPLLYRYFSSFYLRSFTRINNSIFLMKGKNGIFIEFYSSLQTKVPEEYNKYVIIVS